MKRWDKIIIISLIVISFIPQLVYSVVAGQDYNKLYATVTIDGKLYQKILLTGEQVEKEYLISTTYGENLLCVKEGKISMIDADCPDQICMQSKVISRPGQSLICLPHRLCVQIEGITEDEEAVDITAY